MTISAAMTEFAWNRTHGDYLLSALIGALTAAVVDLKVTDNE